MDEGTSTLNNLHYYLCPDIFGVRHGLVWDPRNYDFLLGSDTLVLAVWLLFQ